MLTSCQALIGDTFVWLQRKGGSQKLDPPPLFKGGGGSGSPESQPSPKSLNFLLILYFSRSFLEHVSWNCIFRAYTMIYWAKTGPFWHKNEKQGGGVPVYCYTPVESLLQLRASPPFKAFILALGVQESTKNEKNLPPLLIFQKRGEGSLSDFLRLP